MLPTLYMNIKQKMADLNTIAGKNI